MRFADTLRFLCIAALLVAISAPQSLADLTVDIVDGSRDNTSGGGLMAYGDWGVGLTSLAWDVDLVTTDDSKPLYYIYEYTFTVPAATNRALSHSIIQVSNPWNAWEEDLANDSLSLEGLAAYLGSYDPDPPNEKPNPGMPAAIYGLKFEMEDPDVDFTPAPGTQNVFTWSFRSLRDPIWGNTYSADGRSSIDWDNNPDTKDYNFAFNTGFGSAIPAYVPGVDQTDFVIVPDTHMIPVPSAILLGAIGLGSAGIRLRKRRA